MTPLRFDHRTRNNAPGRSLLAFAIVTLLTQPAHAQRGAGNLTLKEPSSFQVYQRGLKPSRHIAGFSIRGEDGGEIPLIFDAAVGTARDTVILKLIGPLPEKAELWYGHGYDPDCNLTDGLDMAVPAFGPVPVSALQ